MFPSYYEKLPNGPSAVSALMLYPHLTLGLNVVDEVTSPVQQARRAGLLASSTSLLSNVVAVLAALLLIAPVWAADPADSKVDYLTHIKPLLETKCYACHGALKQEAGLRLETLSLMNAGGDSGPAVIASDPNSLLLERVAGEADERMPPADEGAPLKADEIELLRNWIAAGAIAPEEAIPIAPNAHWAFQRIERPSVEGPPAAAIDALLEAKWQPLQLRPQPQAERTLLIRRLYLDLIGLPPTLEQLHDQRPWEQIVDELLASPHHGERWGRHWMDVWRYSDWYGLGAQLRNSQKHLWRWRDWIVTSLNNDKGYDRMVHEMLAGDELAPNDAEVVAGTGFLARNYYLFNRTTWLDSTIEHTSKAFLGLTLNCAKCHDHKYDPLSQVDYYNFRALFEPHQVRLDPVPGQINLEQDGLPRVFDDHLDERTYLHVRGDSANLDQETEIQPQVPALLAGFQPKIESVELPPAAYAPMVRDYVQQDVLNAAKLKVATAEKELLSAEQKLAAAALQENAAELPVDPESFNFADDFNELRPDIWEVVGDGWQYADGSVRQTQATREKEFLRLKQQLPRDFDVTCRFTTTGGSTYKSVTFRFDESDDHQYANYVYTSAYEAGPKVQVAYSRDGSSSYPPEGQARRQVAVGQPQVLRFAVRDRLVNVWWNNEFVVAYYLPDRRPAGHFSLSGFDATVAFDSLTIRALATDVELKPAQNQTDASDPVTVVSMAKAKLHSARADLAAREATLAADLAKYASDERSAAQQEADQAAGSDMLFEAAARLQAAAKVAAAEHEVLVAGGDAAKVKAAQEKVEAAKKKLAAVDAGDHSYTSLRVSLKALETPAHTDADYSAVYPDTSTGRRLALARWITSRDNPLAARVAVNHVWMRHFGEPLVENVFDFGLRTKQPIQADVLDYLAIEFIESGWSFKHLHRLIVISEAYRRSSHTAGADAHTLATDPNNNFYWRMNARRMESQVVRDSLLHLSGSLDPQLGGPSVDVGPGSYRRSLYFKHSRDDQDKFLTMFDDADLLQCYRRSESIVPQQALALANSQLSMTQAEEIAKRIMADCQSVSNDNQESTAERMRHFIDKSIETLLARAATDEERQVCEAFCSQLEELLAPEQLEAEALQLRIHTRLVHSLLNHNDFVSIR
ncbi:MAG: DUF1553 domain-containing protein [Pirellulaceae bacterium]